MGASMDCLIPEGLADVQLKVWGSWTQTHVMLYFRPDADLLPVSPFL